MPWRESIFSGSFSMTVKAFSPKAFTRTLAKCGPMPLTIPEPRYFSTPSTGAGRDNLQLSGFELQTVGPVVVPGTNTLDELTGGTRRLRR